MEAGARTDRLRSLTISPAAFAWFAYFALAALFLIVVSGATVRLTGSGLGCENWPRCGETLLPPKDYNAYVEFGNRVMGFAVGITTLIAAGAAFRVPGLPRLAPLEPRSRFRSPCWRRGSSAGSRSSSSSTR